MQSNVKISEKQIRLLGLSKDVSLLKPELSLSFYITDVPIQSPPLNALIMSMDELDNAFLIKFCHLCLQPVCHFLLQLCVVVKALRSTSSLLGTSGSHLVQDPGCMVDEETTPTGMIRELHMRDLPCEVERYRESTEFSSSTFRYALDRSSEVV
ncbi:hypothetical protein J6590_035918 [Homalodisca vitripennis]|nr:hypothetical protein J6590_035918 [Homalodisca vitripennis]